MALTNILLLSQIAGHVIGLILSLCIIIAMSMHQEEFTGKCLLFSHGTWQENDGQLLVAWASRAYCEYVIVVAVLMFIVCCVQIYRLSMFMYKSVDSSFLSAFFEAVVCAVLCSLTLCAAIIVTLGFMTWCQVIVERFPSCEDAAGENYIDKKDKNISTAGFYIEIGTAQGVTTAIRNLAACGDCNHSLNAVNALAISASFGAWASFATWVGLAVFSTLKVCRYHQLENIQVSMYRERQRLVNENGSPTAQDGRSTPPVDSIAN